MRLFNAIKTHSKFFIIGYNFKLDNSEVSEPRYIIGTSVENIIRLANCDPSYSERGLNVFK